MLTMNLSNLSTSNPAWTLDGSGSIPSTPSATSFTCSTIPSGDSTTSSCTLSLNYKPTKLDDKGSLSLDFNYSVNAGSPSVSGKTITFTYSGPTTAPSITIKPYNKLAYLVKNSDSTVSIQSAVQNTNGSFTEGGTGNINTDPKHGLQQFAIPVIISVGDASKVSFATTTSSIPICSAVSHSLVLSQDGKNILFNNLASGTPTISSATSCSFTVNNIVTPISFDVLFNRTFNDWCTNSDPTSPIGKSINKISSGQCSAVNLPSIDIEDSSSSYDFSPITGFANITSLVFAVQSLSIPNASLDNLTNLAHLKINAGSNFTLQTGFFDKLTNLQTLNLAGNSLTTLPAGIFDKLTKVTDLDLSYNNITVLPNNIFGNLTSLTSGLSKLSISRQT